MNVEEVEEEEEVFDGRSMRMLEKDGDENKGRERRQLHLGEVRVKEKKERE